MRYKFSFSFLVKIICYAYRNLFPRIIFLCDTCNQLNLLLIMVKECIVRKDFEYAEVAKHERNQMGEVYYTVLKQLNQLI